MARPLREISSTGIYHVMLRGINRQIIFEHPVDYRKFIDLLCLMISPSDELGRPLPSLCRIYAYCLMPNHVHMIIQEKSENLSIVIHRIATAYALYYNKKYERCGHLFQDRFRSEPIKGRNDAWPHCAQKDRFSAKIQYKVNKSLVHRKKIVIFAPNCK